MTSQITYLGDLRTKSIHLQSGTEILTDAPTDNHGRGEAFSPTDMVANSLATCMLTIMGMKARDLGLDIVNSTAEVTKVMQAEPRKIAQIIVVMKIRLAADAKTRTILERAALTCPVFLSLHPEIAKDVAFEWAN